MKRGELRNLALALRGLLPFARSFKLVYGFTRNLKLLSSEMESSDAALIAVMKEHGGTPPPEGQGAWDIPADRREAYNAAITPFLTEDVSVELYHLPLALFEAPEAFKADAPLAELLGPLVGTIIDDA